MVDGVPVRGMISTHAAEDILEAVRPVHAKLEISMRALWDEEAAKLTKLDLTIVWLPLWRRKPMAGIVAQETLVHGLLSIGGLAHVVE